MSLHILPHFPYVASGESVEVKQNTEQNSSELLQMSKVVLQINT